MINFPTSKDTLVNPSSTDPRNNPSLAGEISDLNDAVEALETKVGIDSSADLTSLDYLSKSFYEGVLLNGLISATVSGGTLTVSVKGKNGSDPSSTNPIICIIGGVIRKITAPLSSSLASGTNWFGSGGTMLAAIERDYFTYLGYNATNGITLGFSPMSYIRQYSHFSTTSTNQAYGAVSTTTNALATDSYNVIGRFAATLSGTPNFVWSVPTFTPNNLIQRPIYDSRCFDWVATVAFPSAGVAPSTLDSHVYKYKISYNYLAFSFLTSYTNAGTNVIYSQHSLPVATSVTNLTLNINHGISNTSMIATQGYYYNGNAEAVGTAGSWNRFQGNGFIPIL